MNQQLPKSLNIEGVEEFWFQPGDAQSEAAAYRPAVLVECTINFRSLRAGLNHSEEQNYTAWIPEGDLAIDWDSPAANFGEKDRLASQPVPELGYRQGNYSTTKSDLEQYKSELLDKLIRKERLKIFFNPVFGLFSGPNDSPDNFLSRVAEAALGRVEPELKRLRHRFELHLEQVREAHSVRGLSTENLSEKLILNNLHFFESENRLAAMFSTLAGTVFGAIKPRTDSEPYEPDESELREDLERIEQEASEALRSLYGEYLTLASEHDIFEIGLQLDNIHVTRRALLWVPVTE